ncbi:probable serine/threonine-protein kinase DDB_G0278845 [Mytilus edulis]|uniref:probable serine/threonine-protein kinase DDB_G0278845 n=1 Tax=Mytilus edulis TaxID=6550 RepID=UPI0039EE4BBD
MIQNITPPNESTGLLQREIVIYSVVIGCVLLTIGLTSFVRKYRKKNQGKATKPGIPNKDQSNSLRQTRSHVDSASSLYAEIDETMLVENVDMRTWQAKKLANANEALQTNDNTSYLSPVHSEGDSSSFRGSERVVSRSYLSLHESDQNQNSDEFDKDDDATSYLHPYHSIDDDWKEKTHQYDVTHTPKRDTDDSSDSSTQMLTDGYLNPYQPLNEDWKQTSHSYEVPVTIHKCQGSSLSSLLTSNNDIKGEDTERIENNLHSKVNILPFVTDNSKNTILEENSSNEIKPKTTITDTSFNQEVTSKAEINESSTSFHNNFENSEKFENKCEGAMNDCCNTQKANELDSVLNSDVKYLGNSENNQSNLNSLIVLANNEIDLDISESITNVHDYTDAKSQTNVAI